MSQTTTASTLALEREREFERLAGTLKFTSSSQQAPLDWNDDVFVTQFLSPSWSLCKRSSRVEAGNAAIITLAMYHGQVLEPTVIWDSVRSIFSYMRMSDKTKYLFPSTLFSTEATEEIKAHAIDVKAPDYAFPNRSSTSTGGDVSIKVSDVRKELSKARAAVVVASAIKGPPDAPGKVAQKYCDEFIHIVGLRILVTLRLLVKTPLSVENFFGKTFMKLVKTWYPWIDQSNWIPIPPSQQFLANYQESMKSSNNVWKRLVIGVIETARCVNALDKNEVQGMMFQSVLITLTNHAMPLVKHFLDAANVTGGAAINLGRAMRNSLLSSSVDNYMGYQAETEKANQFTSPFARFLTPNTYQKVSFKQNKLCCAVLAWIQERLDTKSPMWEYNKNMKLLTTDELIHAYGMAKSIIDVLAGDALSLTGYNETSNSVIAKNQAFMTSKAAADVRALLSKKRREDAEMDEEEESPDSGPNGGPSGASGSSPESAFT